MRKTQFAALLAAMTLLAGCTSLAIKGLFHIPEARASMQIAPNTPVARVLGCAQRRLAELQKQDMLWDQKITRLDIGAGVLESGDFDQDNISGFRLRLLYQYTTGSIDLRMKGSGAYFADMGVEPALLEFKQGFQACLEDQ